MNMLQRELLRSSLIALLGTYSFYKFQLVPVIFSPHLLVRKVVPLVWFSAYSLSIAITSIVSYEAARRPFGVFDSPSLHVKCSEPFTGRSKLLASSSSTESLSTCSTTAGTSSRCLSDIEEDGEALRRHSCLHHGPVIFTPELMTSMPCAGPLLALLLAITAGTFVVAAWPVYGLLGLPVVILSVCGLINLDHFLRLLGVLPWLRWSLCLGTFTLIGTVQQLSCSEQSLMSLRESMTTGTLWHTYGSWVALHVGFATILWTQTSGLFDAKLSDWCSQLFEPFSSDDKRPPAGKGRAVPFMDGDAQKPFVRLEPILRHTMVVSPGAY